MPKIFHSRKKRRRTSLVSKGCFFCFEKIKEVSYKDVASLSKFLSPRGKIVPRLRSGVCARHQRGLSRAVKIARINALLPFKENNIS